MTPALAQLDPEWAWAPYEPDETTPWTRRLAAHLYRRAGLGADAAQLDQAVQQPPRQAVQQLLQREEPETFRREMAELARSTIATGDAANLPAWWTYRLLTTPHPVLEKLTLFWHGHFATSAAKVTDPELMYVQNELLRKYALGHFGTLVQEISRDPAMLLWLDSATNRKAHPNENYARELMELFCLGEGNYTETDIRELARCFTGWEIKLKQFRFNRFQHDGGVKTVLGETGNFGGEEGVAIVLKQASGPRFIVRKLIRAFLFEEPEPPEALVEPLARRLREHDLQIAPVVEQMLSSRLCFSRHAVARRVRSPIEFALGTLRSLEATTNTYDLAAGLGDLGQRLFYPPNVKGWDGGRTWINSATLLARANLLRRLLDHEKTRFAGGTLTAFVERHAGRRGDEIVGWLDELLLAVPLPVEVRSHLARQLDAASSANREPRLKDAVHLMATQPEFQLG